MTKLEIEEKIIEASLNTIDFLRENEISIAAIGPFLIQIENTFGIDSLGERVMQRVRSHYQLDDSN